MNRLYPIVALLLFLTTNMTSNANTDNQTPERVIWDKKPIAVLLKKGQERLVHFPTDIRYWLPDGADTLLHVLSANGVLYLTAIEPFETMRLRIQDINSQQLYLLDVTGTEVGEYPQELVILHTEKIHNRAKQANPVINKGDWLVRLTRFAAQSLYAPERLSPADLDIRRVSINTEQPVSIVRGANIEAIPLASWRGGGLTITALQLRNLTDHTVVIGTRGSDATHARLVDLQTDLRGSWLTASVQHDVLTSAGSDEDRTCLYLISKQPFEASL